MRENICSSGLLSSRRFTWPPIAASRLFTLTLYWDIVRLPGDLGPWSERERLECYAIFNL